MAGPEANNSEPIDIGRLKANCVVHAHSEFRGIVGERFILKVTGVRRTPEGTVFKLTDLAGRPDEVTAEEIAKGRKGVMHFDGFSNGSTAQIFDQASNNIVNGVYKKRETTPELNV